MAGIRYKLAFIGIVLVLPVLLLMISELSLCIAGYGHSGGLFAVNPASPVRGTFIVDKHFYGRFFPAADREWILNSGNWGWEITKEKEPGTVRIFVLGGSVALGDQTDYAFSNARILEVMLRKSFPGTPFEICNLACGALNSHVMRRVAIQAAAFSPDIFLVYMGNNEYLGPYGPAWSPRGLPPEAEWVQRRISLQESRLVQVMNALMPSGKYLISGGPQGVFEGTVKIRHDDPGRMIMYRSFDVNLSEICKTAFSAGAVTVLCTIGTNLRDWTPYAPMHKADISEEELVQWESHFQAGVELQRQWGSGEEGLVRDTLERYLEAGKLDPFHADLQFRLGECHWRLGEYPEAREAFTRARDYDGFAIRADSTINRIIRDCADRHENTVLADIEKRFIQVSDQGIMGADFFYDYVHVLFAGDFQIASGLFDAVKGVMKERFDKQPAADTANLLYCRESLGMSDYLEARFLEGVVEEVEVSRAYNKRLNTEVLSTRRAAAEARLNEASFDEALDSLRKTDLYKEGDVHISRLLVELLQEAGRVSDAATEAQRILKIFPTRPDAQRVSKMVSS